MSAISHPVPAADVRSGNDQPTCTLHWICAQLGFEGSDARRAAYVEGLIEQRGFPRPFPHSVHGGGLSDAVNPRRSRWLRIAVERWLSDFLPPDAAAAIDSEAAAAAAAEMDAAAARLTPLRLVAGRDASGGVS